MTRNTIERMNYATRGIRLLRIPYYDKYKLDEILAREVLTWVQE